MSKGMEAGVRPWAFTLSERELLQGPERGQPWADCVPQSETSPIRALIFSVKRGSGSSDLTELW